MANQTDLILRLRADQQRLQKDLNKATAHTKKFTSNMQRMGQQIAGAFALTFGATAILGGIRKVTEAYDKQEKALAQVRTGLESTGGTAGRTFGQLQKMASELQKKTLFGDEDILQNATAQLLTFTNIAGEQFDRTQKAALDLATRLDGDLKSASIQLGKALNDPIANLSALSRSGIQFSAEQKAVIKALAETNRLAEAQTIILDELEKQYGGSAEAAAEAGTGGLTQLGNAFSDLSEQIGALVINNSGTNGLIGWLKDLTEQTTSTLAGLNRLSGANFFKALVGLASPYSAAATTAGLNVLGSPLVAPGTTSAAKTGGGKPSAAQPTGPGPSGYSTMDMFGLQAMKGQVSGLIEMNKALEEQARLLEEIYGEKMKQKLYSFMGAMMDYEQLVISIRLQLDTLNSIIEQTVERAISAFVEGLATGGIKKAFANLLNVVGTGLEGLGSALIAFGVAMEAFKKAFSNPYAAIAAGVAAITAGALVKGYASQLGSVSGGSRGGGGGSRVNLSSQSVTVNVSGVVQGQDLVLIGQRTGSRNNRIGG